MRHLLFAVACALTIVRSQPLQAQVAAPDDTAAFLDAGAASLLTRARTARVQADRSLRSYTAVVKSRLAAGLRTSLKDRTLFRTESAARVRWSRDTIAVIQMMAGRTQHPGGVFPSRGMQGLGLDKLYDPAGDRMYFGLSMWEPTDGDSSEDFWIEHPLADGGERHYRYASGDTLTISLEDGRVLRTVELVVTPRATDPHTVHGSLMIDTETGALVQATFRLARAVNVLTETDIMDPEDLAGAQKIPGLVTPIEFNITLMTVEYSLWEMKHWLPYSMRFDGVFRMGIAKFPASADVHYDVTEVLSGDATTESEGRAVVRTAAAWTADGTNLRRVIVRDRKRYIVITPRNRRRLLASDELPPPIWSDAPGFASKAEVERLYDRLAKITGAERGPPSSITWDARYNRVEALSAGPHLTLKTPFGPVGAGVRAGIGDLQPNARIALRRESMRRTIELRAYHELTTTDPSLAPLALGNSISALLFGRDDGEYFRASGAALTWTAPPERRQDWDLTGYAEYQNDVARNTHIAFPRLWSDSVFRTNITADEAAQYGALMRYRPWWGTDPMRRQVGVELMLQGEAGDYRHARASATLHGAAPLLRGVRLGVETAIGTSTGDVPVQRLFYLGGASTLRGYESSTINGTSMARARLEIARSISFANFALFSDWGWAGDRDASVTRLQQRLSVGAGASFLDGLVRFDVARALWAPRGWRAGLQFDAIL